MALITDNGIHFVRVTRHKENLPGQLEAIDRLCAGTEWRRVGYYPAPSRDIGLQRLPRRGYPIPVRLLRAQLAGKTDSNSRAERYGALGYLINGDDVLT